MKLFLANFKVPKITLILILILESLFVSMTLAQSPLPIPEDPYLYMEEVLGTQALYWADSQNERTFKTLKNDLRFQQTLDKVLPLLTSSDRLPTNSVLQNGVVYNLWQDQNHKQGLWRRVKLIDFGKQNPPWETILDLDQLAKDEKKNWVWHGFSCSKTNESLCLITLSDGGKDASVKREFNLATKTFVANGFILPESKSSVAWIDDNTLLVGSAMTADELTDSGYPRVLRVWKRGQKWQDSEIIYEIPNSEMGIWPETISQGDHVYVTAVQAPSFFTNKVFLYENQKLRPLPIPETAQFQGIFQAKNQSQTQAFVILRDPLTVKKKTNSETISAGSVVAIDINANSSAEASRVYSPQKREAISSVLIGKKNIYMVGTSNVRREIHELVQIANQLNAVRINYPENGDVSVLSFDSQSDSLLVFFENFFIPMSIYLQKNHQVKKLMSMPSRFDEGPFEALQYEATSLDGTQIPYFIIKKKDMIFDGNNPTLLYGYGGFEISMTPYYLSVPGNVWLSKGGVYVLANIRGGGEFGPAWHQAALKENRQRAFDDFIAVAEDLIKRKVTSTKKLAIEGGSNGGLLVGTVMVERPDLFQAVICQVPLLDMARYHLLPPGDSWSEEYGTVDDPTDNYKVGRAILKYSPYQNVKENVKYPHVFFETSRKDDRVQPGHARKMAKKLEQFSQDFLYYENPEGGHGAAANLQERAERISMEFTFLYQQLLD